MNRKMMLLGVACLFSLGVDGATRGGACNPPSDPPRPEPPPAKLEFTDLIVDGAVVADDGSIRANTGDLITIKWKYKDPEVLLRHDIRYYYFTLKGFDYTAEAITPQFDGEYYWDAFIFNGPVTVLLEAWWDNSGKETYINLAFDILLDESYYFTATVSSDNPNYPRLGYAKGQNSRIITFSHFLGIYEYGEDYLIDEFARNEDITRYLPIEYIFRGRSQNEYESQDPSKPGFGFEQGCKFPLLQADFIWGTPDGAHFQDQFTPADMIVFAGAIAYSGEEKTMYIGKEKATVRTGVPEFEPIFIAIDVAVDQVNGETTGIPYVTDIHLGNVWQGLVVAVYDGLTAYRLMGQGAVGPGDCGPDAFQSDKVCYWFEDPEPAPGRIAGHIKGSTLGFHVTMANGQPVEPGGAVYVVLDVMWEVPLYPDYNLGGRLPLN